MDVVSSVVSITGLVFTFAKALKTTNDLHTRYLNVPSTISAISHELETLQAALRELAGLMMGDAVALTSRWESSGGSHGMSRTFERAIRGFEHTLKALEGDLKMRRKKEIAHGARPMILAADEDDIGSSYSHQKLIQGTGKKMTTMTLKEKIKVLWNEDSMKEHLSQLRAQSQAMGLLLIVLQTGSISDVKNNQMTVEAALVQLTHKIETAIEARRQVPAALTQLLDDGTQEDLLDLEWAPISNLALDWTPSPNAAVLESALGRKTTDGEVVLEIAAKVVKPQEIEYTPSKTREVKLPLEPIDLSPDDDTPVILSSSRSVSSDFDISPSLDESSFPARKDSGIDLEKGRVISLLTPMPSCSVRVVGSFSKEIKVKASSDYNVKQKGVINFCKGQVISAVKETDDDEWYHGRYIDSKGKSYEGIFPKEFVERCQSPAPSTEPSIQRLAERVTISPPYSIVPVVETKNETLDSTKIQSAFVTVGTLQPSGSKIKLDRPSTTETIVSESDKGSGNCTVKETEDIKEEKKQDNWTRAKRGASSRRTDSWSTEIEAQPEIIWHAIRDDLDAVNGLLKGGQNVDAIDPKNRRTALISTSMLGHIDMVRLLVEHGANVNASDMYSRTAMHYAAFEGHLDCVQLLLLNDAKVDCTDLFYETPLIWAVMYNRTEVVRAMLPEVANIFDHPKARFNTSLLHIAAGMGAIPILKLLLDTRSVDEHLKSCAKYGEITLPQPSMVKASSSTCGFCDEDSWGRTPFHTAIVNEVSTALPILAPYYPSSLDSPWKYTGHETVQTPLEFSIEQCNMELSVALLEAGACAGGFKGQTESPLQRAIHTKQKETTVMLLKWANFSRQCKVHKKDTLLAEAVRRLGQEVLDELLDMSKKDDALETPCGETLLQVAQENGRWDIVSHLIKGCKSSNAQMVLDRRETLHYAMKTNHLATVSCVLRKGRASPDIDINVGNNRWLKPIHSAAMEGSIGVAQLLVSCGADLLEQANNSWIPLHYAIRYNDEYKVLQWYLQETRIELQQFRPVESDFSHVLTLAFAVACRVGSLKRAALIYENRESFTDHTRFRFDLQLERGGGPLGTSSSSVLAASRPMFLYSALHSAVKYGRVDIVRYLLGRGHDAKAQDFEGQTADLTSFSQVSERGLKANSWEDFQICIKEVRGALLFYNPRPHEAEWEDDGF